MDCLYALIRCLTLFKKWETWGWLFQELVLSLEISLFLSLDLWCKDLFPKKKIRLFGTMDRLYTLVRYMFDFVQEMVDLKLAL